MSFFRWFGQKQKDLSRADSKEAHTKEPPKNDDDDGGNDDASGAKTQGSRVESGNIDQDKSQNPAPVWFDLQSKANKSEPRSIRGMLGGKKYFNDPDFEEIIENARQNDGQNGELKNSKQPDNKDS